jgi:hypothetical protein
MYNNFTTISLYKKVVDFWYHTGISPLRFNYNGSCREENTNTTIENGSYIENFKSSKGFMANSSDNGQQRKKLEIYQVCNLKTASPLFWVAFSFLVFSISFSFIQLIRFASDPSADIPSIIGSCCWCSYILSCFFIYIVHLLKSNGLCEFLMEWQQVEGEIFSGMKSYLWLSISSLKI